MKNGVLIGALVVVAIVFLGGYWLVIGDTSPQGDEDLTIINEEGLHDEFEQVAAEPESVSTSTPTLTGSSPSPVIGGTSPAPAAEATVVDVTVRGRNFSFTPSEIRVQQGDTVRLTFINEGGTHDWKIDEFNAATDVIQGGQQETIEFVADRAGSFEYYCSVGQHREMGMKGTLIVE